MAATKSLGRVLCDELQEAGAKCVFGIPGDFILPLFQIMDKESDLRILTLSHEPGIGFAACGAARLRGSKSPGFTVVAVTYGVGALNMVNPIAAAFTEKNPVLVIAGGPGTDERTGSIFLHHQVRSLESQLKIFREITCYQAVLKDTETAAEKIAHGIAMCRAMSLPVYLEVPRDMIQKPVRVGHPLLQRQIPFNPDAVVEAAAEIHYKLSHASRPVLVAGVEVHRFCLSDAVVRLAEVLDVPVVTTFFGRGCFPDDHPLYAGTYLGAASPPGVQDLVEATDCLLLLGVILCDTNMAIRLSAVDPRRTVLAFNRQVKIGYHKYDDIPLPDLVAHLTAKGGLGGDASSSAKRKQSAADAPPGKQIKVAEGATTTGAAALATSNATTGIGRAKVHVPRRVFAVADGCAPASTKSPATVNEMVAEVNLFLREAGEMAIVADVGDCMFACHEIDTQMVLASAYYASMGFAIPAAMGFQVAGGDRPLVITGDGGFCMTGWEMIHAGRWGVNPIVLVMNNASWGVLQTLQPGGRHYTDTVSVPFADVAKAWGAPSWRVDNASELRKALREACQQQQPAMIELLLARGDISSTLATFAHSYRGPQKGEVEGSKATPAAQCQGCV
eukprot:jgi/Mesvir1/22653/Mv14087-RA.1